MFRRIPWTRVLTIAVLASTAPARPAVAEAPPTVEDRTVREVLARQKGDRLDVYLKNDRGTYVNGKQLSDKALARIVRETRAESVVITAEPTVGEKRLERVRALVRDGGVENVEVGDRPPRPVEGTDAKVKLILHRQKGDQVAVYLNSRGAYVNGKSVSVQLLPRIMRESKLAEAVINAEPYVTPKYVAYVEKALKQGGAEKIGIEAPTPRPVAGTRKPRPVAGATANVKQVLGRQQGDQLNVYLNDRGTYVNGKSLTRKDLLTILRDSGLRQVVITTDGSATAARIDAVEKTIRSAGIKNVERAAVKE